MTRTVAALALTAVAACHDTTGPGIDGRLSQGQALNVTGGATFNLDPGTTNGEYFAVLVNNDLLASNTASYTLRGDGLVAPTGYLASTDGARFATAVVQGQGTPEAPVLDEAFESRLRNRERALTPLFADARTWYAARNGTPTTLGGITVTRSNSAIPSSVAVGDTVTVNVNGNDACSNPINHKARVAAIGTHALILDDVGNPRPGFTDADYARYAARFDTLVWPIDVAAFGTPTDIDGNGHIGLIFTYAVNQLTPPNSSSYIAGFHFSRDLFPLTTTGRLQGCPTSNVGELFYLLAPDPNGIYGNRRTTGFVDSNTTAVIAHEFQHLINNSRRLYVNGANALEAKWLDEGLAHTAEELLFYHEAGLTPRLDLNATQIRANNTVRTAFNLDMIGNSGRYRSYLLRPQNSSPYANNDSLQTRGATWDLLRYILDHTGSSDGDLLFRVVNSVDTGTVNLQAVVGGRLPTLVRDWSVSNATDDVLSTDATLQQLSWDWHSNYTALYGAYPLPVTTLGNGVSASGTVTAGGSAYFRLAVPANTTAPISLSASGGNLQLVIVRTK